MQRTDQFLYLPYSNSRFLIHSTYHSKSRANDFAYIEGLPPPHSELFPHNFSLNFSLHFHDINPQLDTQLILHSLESNPSITSY